jgi:acyl-CoA thioesterase FadM
LVDILWVGWSVGFFTLAGRTARGRTIYALTLVIRYLREVKEGALFSVFAQIFELDVKRLRVWFEMQHGALGYALATSEQLIACVDQGGEKPRIAAGPPQVKAAFDAIVTGQPELPAPEQAAMGISLRRRAAPEGMGAGHEKPPARRSLSPAPTARPHPCAMMSRPVGSRGCVSFSLWRNSEMVW